MESDEGCSSYYGVLGVSVDSSDDQIRRAYRKLAMAKKYSFGEIQNMFWEMAQSFNYSDTSCFDYDTQYNEPNWSQEMFTWDADYSRSSKRARANTNPLPRFHQSDFGSDVDKYRCFMSGEGEKNTKWSSGVPPNFDAVNKLFEEGRTKIWPTGSLEEQVQNLVKTWEMESFHKINPQDIKSINVAKFTISVNGRKPLTRAEVAKIGGGYNNFLQTSLPHNLRIYDPNEENADTALKLFTTTFPRGFAVEILQVYSGPPIIVYKFRHWGYMEGEFKGQPPTGELVEMFGVSIMELDENFKVSKMEFFYDRGELLAGLIKGEVESISQDFITSGTSSSCPFS
ncbi:pathogen-related protein [Artemisia annua]|uniref:Pathogen-related protein n=1 Tax=Artemisia annua TaxID=35608 RepID=A0A2U1LLF1_ARTAN|nr:pathogen-related protein [Artemisia annua]